MTYHQYFTQSKRYNGDVFYKLTDNAPEWLSDAIRDAHAGMMPDDYTYEWAYDAACAYDDLDGDMDNAISDLEAEPYYKALAAWFSSHIERGRLVDEALQELRPDSVYDVISIAQIREKERVYQVIFEAIQENEVEG